ncbi:hypothetical protein PUNSTDRAFT_137789 [Punctularia strigosozonata HHB-11173 SS5]|uniref:Fungal-type protein kinase domain-containing protein n=1 Tax=Punctularia strigosozonata (strain HHB-11173) TaxID=741275 RepID=R7S4E5_PUNST|nr:uncharacterized protein PUNSTDRAFT_137789 [Punctularia strigosozonata HHB-11173 SS5]EIN05103.1 hypothetical protein PUNSTDRAFT_137789 [Punctularia strigosozonata HHB-11173 SS5]
MWFSGVLHRNISPSNIIIARETDGKVGYLIDLDCSHEFEKWIEFPAANIDNYQDKPSLLRNAKNELGLTITEDTALRLLADFTLRNALNFLAVARNMWENMPDCIVPEPDPDPKRRSCPDTGDGSDNALMRTGTKSFMSGELVSPGFPYHPGFGRYIVVRGVIHDIESYFWVLVYLCLTRTGNGEWRDELLEDPPEDDVPMKILHKFVYCFFDTSEEIMLNANKTALFKRPDDVEKHIVKAFHPDLICLQPLVLSFWKLLAFSYRTYNDLIPGVIHAQLLKLFDEELKGIKQQFEAQTLDVARSSSDSQPPSASEGHVDDVSCTMKPVPSVHAQYDNGHHIRLPKKARVENN